MKDKLINLIIELARDLQSQEPSQSNATIDSATRLFGKKGLLDSKGLVSLVIAVEQEVEDKFGVSIALADEKALSQESSPYRTVETLAEYAATQMSAEQGG